MDYTGDQKSLRKKQCLYEKFLKNTTTKRLKTRKQYKTLFEKNKTGLESSTKCENNIRSTWKNIS